MGHHYVVRGRARVASVSREKLERAGVGGDNLGGTGDGRGGGRVREGTGPEFDISIGDMIFGGTDAWWFMYLLREQVKLEEQYCRRL